MLRRQFLRLLGKAAAGVCLALSTTLPDLAPREEFTAGDFGGELTQEDLNAAFAQMRRYRSPYYEVFVGSREYERLKALGDFD